MVISIHFQGKTQIEIETQLKHTQTRRHADTHIHTHSQTTGADITG